MLIRLGDESQLHFPGGVNEGSTLYGRSTPKGRFALFCRMIWSIQLLYPICFKHQDNTMILKSSLMVVLEVDLVL